MRIEKEFAVGTIEEISKLIANEICNGEFKGVDYCVVDEHEGKHCNLNEIALEAWLGIKKATADFDSDEEYFASDYYGGGCYASKGIYTKGKNRELIAQRIAELIRESIDLLGECVDERTMIFAETLGDTYWSDPENRELRLNVDFFVKFLPGECEQEAVERIRQMLSEVAQEEETQIDIIFKNREVINR